MSWQIIDSTAPSLQGKMPKLPADLPHGLIRPPDRVRELVGKEAAKHPPGSLSPETLERMLNDWTLQYYFDYLGYEVLYRSTPEGPDVVAVGFEEMDAVRKGMSLEEQLKFKIWMD